MKKQFNGSDQFWEGRKKDMHFNNEILIWNLSGK